VFRKFFLIAILVALVPSVWYLTSLPDTSALRKTNPKMSAIRAYREDRMRTKGGKPHSLVEWRSLSKISPNLIHAVLVAEDDGFYQHHGFDVGQIQNAARTNWKRRRFAFGASTITQQLARTLYLSPNKNLLRKAKEALITRRLEKTLPKKRILELYLNNVEWGPQVYGAEAASRYFFNKPAADLEPGEAISLAAILPSPRRWDPHKQNGYLGRQKAVLYDRMIRAGYLLPTVSVDTEGVVNRLTGFETAESTGPVVSSNTAVLQTIGKLHPAPDEIAPAADEMPENESRP
jgi:monofunctional biosynthetic peptidoglycan transglycosylase